MGGGKTACVPELFHIYPNMMKLGTVVSYLKKIQKDINYLIHRLSSIEIILFSPETSNFFYIKKYRYAFLLIHKF